MSIFNNLFGSSTKNVNEKFDEFIKKSFVNYLYKSAIFNKYAKIYDNNSSFAEECKDIYILSEKLYLNAIKKIPLPFDIKKIKSKHLYIFHLDDIHNDNFIFKDSNSQRIFRPKKQQYLCKVISVIFVKLYILIKGIYSTFNHNLTFNNNDNIQNKQELPTDTYIKENPK